MKKKTNEKIFIFDSNGNFERIGDYCTGDQGGLPFSFQADHVGLLSLQKTAQQGASCTENWKDPAGKISLEIMYEYDADLKIILRKDRLHNLGRKSLTVRKYLARFPLNRGEYEVYNQRSYWGRENHGNWSKIHSGAIELFSRKGRFCEGSTPFAVLRDSYSSHALAFQVFPKGDWKLRFSTCSEVGKNLSMTVEAGLNEDELKLELNPGEVWDAPEVLIQILPDRTACNGAANLNRWLNRKYPVRPGHAPVIYNTWLDQMNQLDLSRMERQLEAAKRCGCEVFVVDYGWYDDNDEFCRLNDWDEYQDRAFFGKMKKFADKVRKAGLGFGFWVEFEFFSDKSVMVKKHPDWFFPSDHEHIVCPKTWLPEVEEYLVKSLADAIRRYKAVYVKNDMNHSQGHDETNLNHYHQDGFYKIMARLRKELPEVTFENCSSGSMRMTPGGMLNSFDLHFISDNADPLNNLRMFQGDAMRFAPGRIFHWYVGSQIHAEKEPKPSFERAVIVQPKVATWFQYQTNDLNFGLLCNMLGPFGFSCDLASFSLENQKKIARYSAFYKKYRESFQRAEMHYLTFPEDFDSTRGWVVFQLSDPKKDIHFIYAFHSLNDNDSRRIFHPQALQEGKRYEISEIFPDPVKGKQKISGSELSEDGVEISFPYNMHESFRGKLLLIQPAK